jgi:hypothetical protein
LEVIADSTNATEVTGGGATQKVFTPPAVLQAESEVQPSATQTLVFWSHTSPLKLPPVSSTRSVLAPEDLLPQS